MNFSVVATSIGVLILSRIADASSVKDEHTRKTCKNSQECVVVGPACGEPVAINIKFQESYEAELGPSPLECNQPSPVKNYKAKCKNSICLIVDSKKE